MSKRNNKAIFERWTEPAENFGEAEGSWEEVTREWVSLEPVALLAQRLEFIDAAQTKGTRKSIAKVTHSPTMAAVDTACRMKIAKTNLVNEQEPDDDANFRIFHIEQMVNVREANRELEIMVTERT